MQETPDSTSFAQVKVLRLQRVYLSLTTAVFWLGLCCGFALADEQKSPPEAVPINPLEITTPDPLLPRQIDDKRPLSSLEQLKLTAALEQLDRQAAAKLAAGDRVGAFEIWNRELRLRRSLGLLSEVQALGRVGAIAWNQNQQSQVQYITQRMQEIQQQAQSQPAVDLRLLRSLGVGYQQLRLPQPAAEVYTQILAVERQSNPLAVETTLRTLAELHISWFDYPKAAATYEELLGLAREQGDRSSEIAYLQQLAYIYEQSKQFQPAVAIKQQLAQIYRNDNQLTQLPQLQLAIGSDYEATGQLNQAFQNYQAAYTSAWSLQQYYRASDALRQLIALYRSQNQIDEALQTSQILLQSEQLASNFYGLMDTYDQIGQIHLKRGSYADALAAFQNGLKLAQQLKYQENYFTQQISQVTQQIYP